MSNVQCFKIKRGTKFDEAVKQHFTLLPKWKEVYDRVSELLGENITKLAFSTDHLMIDPQELTKDDNKRLFKKDGEIKTNTKKAKEINTAYKEIIIDVGLEDYEELRYINFAYGVMRTREQHLESYRTSENDIYYKANFDLEKKTGGLVEPISEIEYQEKYVEELKRQDKAS